MSLGTRTELGVWLSNQPLRMFPTCNTMNCLVHQFFSHSDPTFFGSVDSKVVRRLLRVRKEETDKHNHVRIVEVLEPEFYDTAKWLTRYIDSLDRKYHGQEVSGQDALFLLSAQTLDESEYFEKREVRPLKSRDGQCKTRPAYLRTVTPTGEII